jgi:hypothetical protein
MAHSKQTRHKETIMNAQSLNSGSARTLAKSVSSMPAAASQRRRAAGTGARSTVGAAGNARSNIDESQRREMIATAAFLRAERRGFSSGLEVDDWLSAEEEIDQWIRQVDADEGEPPLFEE